MATMTPTHKIDGRISDAEIGMTVDRLIAQALQAFLECDSAIQQSILELVRIINDPETDPDDVVMSLATLHEALFPARSSADGHLGVDLEEEEQKAVGDERRILDEMDREEGRFAARVEAILKDRGWTQAQLATAIGVGQPAISLLFSRGSRPQRRTVEKIAEALDVPPSELWPESDAG